MIESEFDTKFIAHQSDLDIPYVRSIKPIKTIACLLLSDMVAVLMSLVTAVTIRDRFMHSASKPILGSLLLSVLLVLCSMLASGLYPGVGINPVEEIRKTTISITLAFLSLWSATFLMHDLSESRLVYMLGYGCAVLGVPSLRAAMRRGLSKRQWWGSPVCILGYGDTGRIVLENLQCKLSIGLKPIAVLDDDENRLIDLSENLVSGPLERCLEITQRHRISYAIVCMPGLSRSELLDLLERYGKCFSHVLIIPDLVGMTSLGINAREIGGIVGLELTQQLLRPSAQFVKRVLDLSLTVLAAPIILPLVGAAALLIKLEDGGPIFHSNERVGRRGKSFNAWKLRSMVRNGDEALAGYLEQNPDEKTTWDICQKVKRDPRITRIGRILRKTSIDELPQFWNVLIGEMSVVGPRPMFSQQISLYGKSFSLYVRVRPGITGLWQVSGRNHLSFMDRAKLDKYVIQNWSVWMDIYILFRTISVVLTGRGAY